MVRKRLIEIASICGNSAYFRSFSHSFLYFCELSHTRRAFMVGLTLKLKRVVCNAIEKKNERKKRNWNWKSVKHIFSLAMILRNLSFNLVVPFVHINIISSSNVKVILTSTKLCTAFDTVLRTPRNCHLKCAIYYWPKRSS